MKLRTKLIPLVFIEPVDHAPNQNVMIISPWNSECKRFSCCDSDVIDFSSVKLISWLLKFRCDKVKPKPGYDKVVDSSKPFPACCERLVRKFKPKKTSGRNRSQEFFSSNRTKKFNEVSISNSLNLFLESVRHNKRFIKNCNPLFILLMNQRITKSSTNLVYSSGCQHFFTRWSVQTRFVQVECVVSQNNSSPEK